MKKWILKRKGADFDHISEKFHIDKRLASLIRNRDIISDEDIERYLNGQIKDMYSPFLLLGMEEAVDRILEAIDDGSLIRVIGDYDADGVNSTYVLVAGLTRLGGMVSFDIPDRHLDGYGLSLNLIDKAYKDNIDLIITCDNGIAGKKEIEKAKSLGIDVIVTDHHEVQEDIFPGDSISVIDPKQKDDVYPDKNICGCVVAYKLVLALAETMGFDLSEFYDLIENCAIATICDIVDLQNENRIIVKEGLNRIRKTENIGLNALIKATGIEKDKINPYHLGFIIGPCINASGRLESAKVALKLFLSSDENEASKIANELVELNNERKELTETAYKEAVEIIEKENYNKDNVLVVYIPDANESVAGIVAGKIKDRYYKPTIVLTNSRDGVKGSGRSIESYNLFEELVKVSDLMTKFGGHKLAAGLSLLPENIDNLRNSLNANEDLTEEDLKEKIYLDMELGFRYISKELVHQISLLEPFGKGNSKPVFVNRTAQIVSGKILGTNRNVIRFNLKDDTNTYFTGIFFTDGDRFLEDLKDNFNEKIASDFEQGKKLDLKFTIAFIPEINIYKEVENIQINIKDYFWN
ncbi:MAG: single-stranded-DNA-specific exonuclease RecJ [Lachnospiraceae bacterium]|jgi:single-stranded-DNA-specific exonuclease|nr:single-stranded-DNA-specific exonuclease RecJ [Lachnospiraceae bacterium]